MTINIIIKSVILLSTNQIITSSINESSWLSRWMCSFHLLLFHITIHPCNHHISSSYQKRLSQCSRILNRFRLHNLLGADTEGSDTILLFWYRSSAAHLSYSVALYPPPPINNRASIRLNASSGYRHEGRRVVVLSSFMICNLCVFWAQIKRRETDFSSKHRVPSFAILGVEADRTINNNNRRH